jgi:hypothetical protein
VSDLGSATKVQQTLCRRRRLTGILTVTGTTTVSVYQTSTNQLIDLGASTNQWKTFYTKDAAISGTLSVTGRVL